MQLFRLGPPIPQRIQSVMRIRQYAPLDEESQKDPHRLTSQFDEINAAFDDMKNISLEQALEIFKNTVESFENYTKPNFHTVL